MSVTSRIDLPELALEPPPAHPFVGKSIRERKKEEIKENTPIYARVCTYPLVQTPPAVGTLLSCGAGLGGLAVLGPGIPGYILLGSGVLGGVTNIFSWFCIGKLKTKKDLEELVQEDLREVTEDIDQRLEELNVQVNRIHSAKTELAEQLAAEQKLTEQQKEKLAQLQKLEQGLEKMHQGIQKAVVDVDRETEELREGVDALDSELDETKEHQERAQGQIRRIDQENAEYLEQLQWMEKIVPEVRGIVDDFKETAVAEGKEKEELLAIVEKLERLVQIILQAIERLKHLDALHQRRQKELQGTIERIESIFEKVGVAKLTEDIETLRDNIVG